MKVGRRILLPMYLLIPLVLIAQAPQRSRGISIHMLPKGVADLGHDKWGFTVDFRPYLKAEPEPPVLQSAGDLVLYVRKQDKSVQENGVWIVVTHPDSYSDSEKALLEDAKAACKREQIPLFICRAAELPNGWKRYDQP
jgi:hypothetical protein